MADYRSGHRPAVFDDDEKPDETTIANFEVPERQMPLPEDEVLTTYDEGAEDWTQPSGGGFALGALVEREDAPFLAALAAGDTVSPLDPTKAYVISMTVLGGTGGSQVAIGDPELGPLARIFVAEGVHGFLQVFRGVGEDFYTQLQGSEVDHFFERSLS